MQRMGVFWELLVFEVLFMEIFYSFLPMFMLFFIVADEARKNGVGSKSYREYKWK